MSLRNLNIITITYPPDMPHLASGVSGKGFLAPRNGKGNLKSHSRFTGRQRELENATGREGKFEACNPGNPGNHITSKIKFKILIYFNALNRVHICRDRWDRRSRKNFVDCVNFSVNNANCEQNLPNPHILRKHLCHFYAKCANIGQIYTYCVNICATFTQSV